MPKTTVLEQKRTSDRIVSSVVNSGLLQQGENRQNISKWTKIACHRNKFGTKKGN